MKKRKQSDIIYVYDGSFEGMLCCVYDSFYSGVIPADIFSVEEEQLTLHATRLVETNEENAKRVYDSISRKVSHEAERFIIKAFLSCLPQKELYILKFLALGYRHGKKVMSMLTNDTVNKLTKAVQSCGTEANFFREFLRFSLYGGVMVAAIEPKNYVLPLIEPHYSARYNTEQFVIFDKTHHMALFYKDFKSHILPVEHIDLPEIDGEERLYRSLWRRFYGTIGVEGRENPRCRMTHMPKRYWGNLVEFFEDSDSKPKALRPTVETLQNAENTLVIP